MASIDIETVQRLAQAALAANQPYLYCRVAPMLAEVAPRSDEWILGYIKALLKLGLTGAAREVIDRMDASVRADARIAALAAAVGNAGVGRIPWTSRRRRFEANLRALLDRDERAAEAVACAWAALSDRYELHQCTDGNVQVREVSNSWPTKWLPCLDDHRGLAAGRVSAERIGILPPPLLFDGLGLGWEVLDGYQRTRRVFLNASSAVYIVERRPEAVAIAFHIHDWRTLLGDASVQWFIGADARERLGALLDAQPTWPVTDRYCFSDLFDERPEHPSTTVMATVSQHRVNRSHELRSNIAARYTNRDAAYWVDRFNQAVDRDGRATDRPLRILGITSIHTTFLQYSMRDCLLALDELGHETRLLTEPAEHLHLDTITALKTQLDFEPDVVLLLSRMRDEMQSLIHESIPTVTWDQDSLPWVFDPARQPQLAWNDFLMGFSAASATRRFGWPEHRCMSCSMAGSPWTYSAERLPDDALASFRCDVSYVSHASATVDQEIEHAAGWLPDERLRRVYRAAVERLLPQWMSGGAFPGPLMATTLNVCDGMGERLDPVERSKVSQAVQRIGDRAFRHVALGWVADWAERTGRRFNLWGNGWDKHPRLARFARGATRNGEELRAIYQASRINLQLMGFGFLHQRALDGLMAGAFFMGRRASADAEGPTVRELAELAERYGLRRAANVADVRQPDLKRRIATLCAELNVDVRAWDESMFEQLRVSATTETAGDIIPHFDEISFADAAEFETRAERFLADEPTRNAYAMEMREVLLERYSYVARMAGMLRFVHDGFRREAELSGRMTETVMAGAMR